MNSRSSVLLNLLFGIHVQKVIERQNEASTVVCAVKEPLSPGELVDVHRLSRKILLSQSTWMHPTMHRMRASYAPKSV